ncbi:MAG TPA: hypothetical protein VGQ12_08125 [Candidatus Angelobacter sp.]|jgi:hypothetical protein|nr:hypothetical protein [Candidatus Angelobacter sp.]
MTCKALSKKELESIAEGGLLEMGLTKGQLFTFSAVVNLMAEFAIQVDRAASEQGESNSSTGNNAG